MILSAYVNLAQEILNNGELSGTHYFLFKDGNAVLVSLRDRYQVRTEGNLDIQLVGAIQP